MTIKGNNAVKYVGAALAVGGTALLSTAMASSSSSLKKKAKKTANKAIDTAYSWLTGLSDAVK